MALLVGRDVTQFWKLFQSRENLRRPSGQLGEIGVQQRVLILCACQTAADIDVLCSLHEEYRAFDLGQLRTEAFYDIIRRGVALAPRLERDDAVSHVLSLSWPGADVHCNTGDGRVLADNRAECTRAVGHFSKRNVLRRL